MKFVQLSVILCCLSAIARMISRVPTRSQTMTRSIVIPQRRALTNAFQPPRPIGRDLFKLRLLLLAISIYTAYEVYECFKIFSDHYEPADVHHGPELDQLKQFEKERTKLMDIIYQCDDIPNDECLGMISFSEISNDNKQLLVNLLGNRIDYNDSLISLYAEQQWSNYKSLSSVDRKYFLSSSAPEFKSAIYSFAVQIMVKDLKQFDGPSRTTFLTVLLSFRSDQNSQLFKTHFPDVAEIEEAMTIFGKSYDSIEQEKAVNEISPLFRSFYNDTEGLSMYPFSPEGILFMVDSIGKK